LTPHPGEFLRHSTLVALGGDGQNGTKRMIAGTTVNLWTKRAEQARRFAETLSSRDRELLRDYARECEFRARWVGRVEEARAA
jgi:hypothetical protein